LSLEREIKMIVGPLFRVPDLSDVVPGAVARDEGVQHTVASYYDTPDLRLARWGCSLRYRTGDGWCVKLPTMSEGDTMVRDERVFAGGPGSPPEGALDLVRAYVRTAPLALAVRLRTVRHRLTVAAADEGRLAEVVDDEVSVLDGRRVAGRFREVEVELGPDADDAVLGALATRLENAGGSRTGKGLPKFVRALLPRSLEPPEILVAPTGPESSVRDVIQSSIAASAGRMLRHDAGVRLGEDPEDVHKGRVATRRLRSDLRSFAPLLDEGWTAQLRSELGWYGAELGRVRDLDVLRERMLGQIRRLSDLDVEAAPKLLDRVRTERDAARSALLSAMREPRYLALLDLVVAASLDPLVQPEVAARSARRVMGSLMERPWRHLERTCTDLDASSADAELHQARIRAKRVRYAAEALAPVFGKPARRFAERAFDLQTVLGAHQDAALAIGWLRAQAGGTATSVAFVAGELAGIERQVQAETRAAWPDAWRRLQAKKLRFWGDDE
jgi:CHAD domain-containing protein